MRYNKYNGTLNTSRELGHEEQFVIERPEWQDRAACSGLPLELFFPERGDNISNREAKRICQGCPVKRECLEFALGQHIAHGIWGGTSERQRRVIRRDRAVEIIKNKEES